MPRSARNAEYSFGRFICFMMSLPQLERTWLPSRFRRAILRLVTEDEQTTQRTMDQHREVTTSSCSYIYRCFRRDCSRVDLLMNLSCAKVPPTWTTGRLPEIPRQYHSPGLFLTLFRTMQKTHRKRSGLPFLYLSLMRQWAMKTSHLHDSTMLLLVLFNGCKRLSSHRGRWASKL